MTEIKPRKSFSNWNLDDLPFIIHRPLSATARLPTQRQEGQKDPNVDRPQTVAEIRKRPLSRYERTSVVNNNKLLKSVIGDPKYHNRERRISLTDTEGVGEVGDILKRLNISQIERDLNQKIEEGISLEQLQEIKSAFQEGGEEGLNLDDFKEVFRVVLGINNVEKQIERLFMKIDTSSDGFIDWDEFCSYMQLEYAEKEAIGRRALKVKFNIPAIKSAAVHRDEVIRVQNVGDGGIMSVSQDGLMCFWKGNTMQLEKSVRLGMLDDKRIKSTWVTDCLIVSSLNRVFAFTGDREILIYDSISKEMYCRITGLESVPLRVSHHADDFRVILVMGDEKGCVNLLVIRRLGDTLREWKNQTKDEKGIPTVVIQDAAKHQYVSFNKWKAHEDWITEIMYIKQLNAIISTCNHPGTAICISPMPDIGDHFSMVGSRAQSAKRNSDVTFRPILNHIEISKGVKACAYTPRGNLLATGGIDRIVRLINVPSRTFLITKANGFLKGHNSPVTYVGIQAKENRLISTSQDNVIRIWDISEQTCLLTLNPKTHQIRGDFSAVFFVPTLKGIVIATDVINLLQMKISSSTRNVRIGGSTLSLSHSSPVTSCSYNHTFSQIVTSDETGLIRVWDLESNRKTFEFATKTPVSCIAFDSTHRRLIVGCRDGTSKIYNHNNGGLLKILKPRKLGREVSVVKQVQVGQSEYFLSVGWERRINLFPENDRKHILEQKNLAYWDDDLSKGHKEDIIAATCVHGNLLVTASFDGVFIVWNMISGHAIHRINGTETDLDDSTVDRSRNLSAKIEQPKLQGPFVLSLAAYSAKKKIVLAGHQSGKLLFYNLIGSKPSLIAAPRISNHPLSTIAVMENSELVFCGDSNGMIYAIDLIGYATEEIETREANVYLKWRAHIDNITQLALIDHREILITSSLDCTCRAWTFDGEYIGTFGQEERWDLLDDSTWKHPFTPDDVLVDQTSLPADNESEEREEKQDSKKFMSGSRDFMKGKGDSEILAEVRKTLSTSEGKRLKMQRQISKQSKDSLKDPASNAFRTLKLHSLEMEEEFTRPEKPKSTMDEFMMYESPFTKKVHYL